AEEFLLKAGVGWKPGRVGKETVRNCECTYAGHLLLTNQPAVFVDLSSEKGYRGSPLLHEHQIRSGLSIIIQGVEGAPYGIMGAYTTKARTFTDDDILFLQAMGHMLSLAIERRHVEASIH